MILSSHARAGKLLTRLAAAVALFVAFTPVGIFALSAYYSATRHLDSNLRVQAFALERVISLQPDYWDLNPDRLQAQYQRYVLPGEHFQITNSAGDTVAKIGPPVAWHVLTRTHPLREFGREVGRIEAGKSILGYLQLGLALFCVSLGAAWLIWGPLRRLPLAALAAAETQLVLRDRYQRALLDNFPFAVWLKDTESRYLAVNVGFARAFGAGKADALVGKSDFDIARRDVAERYRSEDRAVLLSGAQTNAEEEVSLEGGRKWFDVYRAPVIGEGGELLGTVGFARDITERKEVETELKQYRYSLEVLVRERTAAIEQSPVGIIIFDSRRTIHYVNPAFAKILGYAEQALVGQSLHFLQSDTQNSALHEHLWKAISDAEVWAGELEVHKSNGEPCWVQASISPILSQGEKPSARQRFVGILDDITDRKMASMQLQESEERFRQSFIYAPIGIAIVSRDGRVGEANPALCGMLGYGEIEVRGMLLDRFFHEAKATQELAKLEQSSQEQMSSISREQVATHKDGRFFPVISTLSLVRDADNRPLSFVAQIEDISERKQAELQNLATGILIAQEQDRAELSHELHDAIGQSLTALKMTLKRAQHNLADPDKVANCLATGQQMLEGLMKEVRSIAYRLRPAEIDQLGLVAALRSHLDKTMRPLGLNVTLAENLGETRLPASLELCCFRVVQEALTNGLRHAQASQMDVSLMREAARLTLSIKDNGIGLDIRQYYSAHENPTSLGLIGMRERVAANGGQLQIRSTLGAGTEVVATFELAGAPV